MIIHAHACIDVLGLRRPPAPLRALCIHIGYLPIDRSWGTLPTYPLYIGYPTRTRTVERPAGPGAESATVLVARPTPPAPPCSYNAVVVLVGGLGTVRVPIPLPLERVENRVGTYEYLPSDAYSRRPRAELLVLIL